MALRDRIVEDMKKAQKQRDPVRLGSLRLLWSQVRKREIDSRVEMLDDAGVIEVIAKKVKTHRESIDAATAGGRQDVASREQAEMEVVLAYMPAPFTPEELASIIAQAIDGVGAVGPSDVGRVMKEVMPAVKGRAEGQRVKDAVRAALESRSP